MSFEKDDRVVLDDKHSEFDDETGTVAQVIGSMLSEPTYTISFDESQEVGIAQDQLGTTDGDDTDETDKE